MAGLYYFAAWTDSGCLLGCDHKHKTVYSAAMCISCAAGYVIAVEDDEQRALNDEEEAEFQQAIYGGEVEMEFDAEGFPATVRIA